MANEKQIKLLRANWFLGCLVVLLINDLYLKSAFPGLLTGKLSDFAGLFIFPYFFSVFFFNRKKQIYVWTAILFIFWKSPASSAFIEWFNSLNFVPITRIVDPTDLVGLIILPVSYNYFNDQLLKELSINRFQISVISCLAVFSFCATTIGNKEYQKKVFIGKTYKLHIAKDRLVEKIKEQSFFSRISAADTLLLASCPVDSAMYSDEDRVFYRVSLTQIQNDTTVISIDSVLTYEIVNQGLFSGPDADTEKYFASLSKIDYEIIFGSNLLRLLKGRAKEYRPMDFNNKWENR